MKLISSPDTQAIVGIPKGSFSKLSAIRVNGTTVWDGAFRPGPSGLSWGKPIAIGLGKIGITPIIFPAQTARFIRITQTGTDPTYNWSIYVLDVYR